MDPMANMNPSQNPSGEASGGTGRQTFSFPIAQHNALHISDARSFMAIVSGCAAGTMGATNARGMVLFCVMHFVSGFAIVLFKFGGRVSKCSAADGLYAFLCEEFQKCALSYILFWTLFFAIVYLFN